ncbi:MAG TPA: DNA polymerase Y family protein [Candidatus Elarobacter sp.]|jgi:protein ImuB|nr:DNA polymerase Y family protein [Candidatus Elarobacter sp.]
MPVVCVWIPAFRLAVARLTNAGVDLDAPLVLADRAERGRVVDCTLTAAALGVRRGMTLVQAQAVATEARTVFDDPAAGARVWSEVLDALDAASPVVEDAGLGRAFVDMRGIAGDPSAWLRAVRAALAGVDRDLANGGASCIRTALGPNRFVAHAAAWRADGTVCDGDTAAFLAPLPLELLAPDESELDANVRERLRLLGVTTLGALAALPHGPFVRRFGPEAARWHDLARGVDDRPLKPRARSVRVDRALYGEGEASSEEQVLFALRTLAGWVVDDLCAAGKRAGRLVLRLDCEDGESRELVTRVAQPTAVPSTLFDLLRARLEGVVLTAPVVGLRLAAEELASGGVALSLFSASDPDPDVLGVVLARLDAALGEGHALRARVVDGPRIERRYALEPFSLAPLATNTVPRENAIRPQRAAATVQLRLVEPRPIDVRVVGGAPRFVGSPPQVVVELAGPWRVEEAWWAPSTGEGVPLARDEYDVCLEDGSLLRIAREGTAWSVRGAYD